MPSGSIKNGAWSLRGRESNVKPYQVINRATEKQSLRSLVRLLETTLLTDSTNKSTSTLSNFCFSYYNAKECSASSLGPGGLDLAQAFFKPIQNNAPPSPTKRHTKISVIGVGNVGMAIAQTILTQDLADELALVDAKPDKLRGEMLDLQHAAAFLPRTKINASVDYSVTVGSDLCIVTAGARQNPGESRLNLLQRNVALFSNIIPPLAKYSPDSILLIVSNPVDVLTYVSWKLSGFPSNRVIGSGTNLDSSRFRFLIADHLDVNAQDVQAYIIGEHGDSSVALWSSISIGGVPVLSFLKNQQIAYEKQTLEDIHKAVIDSAYEVISLKGYTSWAIGYSVANLARSLLRDQRKIHPVSVLAKGFYGIDGGDVFLSLPAQLGRGGVMGVTNIHLTDEEAERLRKSAETILEVQSQLGL
ncbi:L-lactate dehydrogenase B-like [Durio zibethinus]|uniref:L-lactate dehydrogenase n=1 Tax=Durio zibethinus TaxID=66656 RepID=A0A6P5Y9W0_DURZI|nr:L-lactate dehydrogenase B-like [Durio zibethinus]